MKHWLVSFRAVFVFTLLTGALYPAAVTVLGQVFLPGKSSGSLIRREAKVLGSELIAQSFSHPKYFWPRPSAVKHDAASSGATNQSLTAEDFKKAVWEREAQGMTHEMRFASGSGLDPHISPEAARSQIQRVAANRGLNADQTKVLALLIEARTEQRQFGFLGEPRVNVLNLNLELDERFSK